MTRESHHANPLIIKIKVQTMMKMVQTIMKIMVCQSHEC